MNNKEEKSEQASKIRFRADALKHMWDRHGKNELNSMIPSYAWGYLLFICVVLLCLLFWGIFGTVSDYVNGEGLLLTKADSISSISSPIGNNLIKKIYVKQGQIVKKGNIIATFDNPELRSQLPILKDKVSFLDNKLKDYKILSEQELSHRKSLIQDQNKILNKIIAIETNNVNQIESVLKTQNFLSKKGLIRNVDKRYLEQQFADAQRSLENAQSQIISNSISLTTFKDEWQDRIRNLELQYKEASAIYASQQEKLASASHVKADITGKVIDIHKKASDFAIDGETIATIAELSADHELKAIIYIPGLIGKKVKVGMRAMVSPTIIKKEEYGSIEGEIEEVSEYPVNPQEILSTLKNETIVKSLSSKDAPIKAIVRLKTDNGQFKWSSSQGPDFPITEGTYVTTTILVQQQSPISLLIPALKKLMGVTR